MHSKFRRTQTWCPFIPSLHHYLIILCNQPTNILYCNISCPIPLDLRAQPDLGSPFGGVPRVKDLGKKTANRVTQNTFPEENEGKQQQQQQPPQPQKKHGTLQVGKGVLNSQWWDLDIAHLRGWRQTIRFRHGSKWLNRNLIKCGTHDPNCGVSFNQFEPGPPFWNQHQASGYSKVPAFVNFNGHASWDKHVGHTSHWTCMYV